MLYVESDKHAGIDCSSDGLNYGIAYKDAFICGCCGGIFQLVKLAEDGLEIIELPWVSLRDKIRGE